MPDLVALQMPGSQAFVDELKRVWNAGDAVLPIDLRLPRPAANLLLKKMGATALIDENGERHKLSFGYPVESGDALVIATSGSTGEPKGVVHTHASISASAEITSRRLEVTDKDHWLACLPLSHIGGLSVVTRALHMNTKLSVHPRFDADAVMKAASQGVNFVSLVPTALRRINPAVFRLILLGGTAAPRTRPANTVLTYGSTETGSGIVYEQRALDGVELFVDATGQLRVKSPTLLRCYRDDTDPRDENGWYPTGDAASIEDGQLTIYGRMAEVINTGGEKVWPAVVENALKTHDSIAEALVFGENDAEWGQRVVARVELYPGSPLPSLDDLRDHVKQILPAFAAPKEIRIVPALARTPSGKVDRRGKG